MSLQAPVVRLPIAPVPAGEGPPALPDPRQVLAAAAEALGRLPEARLKTARGRVELAAADGTGFQVQDIDLTLARRGGEIELAAEARSDLVRRVAANARLQADSFTGSARLRLEGLQPERPYAFFFPGRPSASWTPKATSSSPSSSTGRSGSRPARPPASRA